MNNEDNSNKASQINSIGIFLLSLNDKDRKIFERVITFNNSNGISTHYSEELDTANIVICHEESMPNDELKNNAVLLVIGNDTSKGDIQITPPLLITRVMKAIETAIQLIGEKTGAVVVPVEQPEQSTPEKKSYHALVIDDSASIRKQLELELRDAGISSDFAESGEQALEKIKDNHFDLVFLDIIMPGIDGYETCKQMRETCAYKKTPIIMLSGKTSPLDEVQGVIAGATCYLTKPVKSDMLQTTLERVTKWIDNFSHKKEVETA